MIGALYVFSTHQSDFSVLKHRSLLPCWAGIRADTPVLCPPRVASWSGVTLQAEMKWRRSVSG